MQLWPLLVHPKMYTFMLLEPEYPAAMVGHSILPELHHWMKETNGGKKAYKNMQGTNSCQC